MADERSAGWRDNLRDGLKDIVRRNHKMFPFRLLAEASKTYLRAYYNENHYRFDHNGEAYAIDALVKRKPPGKVVVFDVGANRGLWTLAVLARRPDAIMHCFEIAPALFEVLATALEGRDDVHVNNIGLSDTNDRLMLNFVPGADTTSSLHETVLPRRWGFTQKSVEVNVTTGDEYCAQQEITHIDLLKTDTEGHDLAVLRGFKDMLKSGKISAIQFEHGFVHIPARSLLYDFYNLLEPCGYKIGRLYPASVAFKEFDACEDEQFRMGNYIAVHESQPDTIDAMRG